MTNYNASSIEVLEGLEAVRKRPGMYIGGTDSDAFNHLFKEILDNSIDEALNGHASLIEVELIDSTTISVKDNGRGIPIEHHSKFPDQSTLEVVLTKLHSGGKFSQRSYHTSGGLHGVGLSVVNALSKELTVEIVRNSKKYKQTYEKGKPVSKLEYVSNQKKKSGTSIKFTPDDTIFKGGVEFSNGKIEEYIETKAYLCPGIKIIYNNKTLDEQNSKNYPKVFFFPEGIKDYLNGKFNENNRIFSQTFYIKQQVEDSEVNCAINWLANDDISIIKSHCNTIYNPDGGTHELGLKSAIIKSIKHFGEIMAIKSSSLITIDDVTSNLVAILNINIVEPEFQGQNKTKLTNSKVSRITENTVLPLLETWLYQNKDTATSLVNDLVIIAEDRIARKNKRNKNKKDGKNKSQLPLKLTDCRNKGKENTELFLVEGDSAGGTAKQARNRETQAILPLRGKILNTFNATESKQKGNQQIKDLILSIGTGSGRDFNINNLRYEKIIIMTDADVDGAHIASLLITFFFIHTQEIIKNGFLYLAVPPLFKISNKDKSIYCTNEKELELHKNKTFKNKKNVTISRFKGLGEMMPKQLKETTMDPNTRKLIKIDLPMENIESIKEIVKDLMGQETEKRLLYIQKKAKNFDINALI